MLIKPHMRYSAERAPTSEKIRIVSDQPAGPTFDAALSKVAHTLWMQTAMPSAAPWLSAIVSAVMSAVLS